MISMLFAADAATAGAVASSPTSMIATFLPLVVIFVLFYFMFIMPQRKEQKKTKEMLAALKEGDKVVTAGGIVGIITKITDKEDTMTITSGENTKLNVLRPYITRKVDKTV
ncbi:MAG: preprotein translocase subunit YajC [bacterium]